jgi:hypothetical protein
MMSRAHHPAHLIQGDVEFVHDLDLGGPSVTDGAGEFLCRLWVPEPEEGPSPAH